MGTVLPFNRAQRRARYAHRRREDRAEQRHLCLVLADAARHGVTGPGPIRVAPTLYHEVHRALGEAHCPLCPRCIDLRRSGSIDAITPWRKITALRAWAELLAAERARQCTTRPPPP